MDADSGIINELSEEAKKELTLDENYVPAEYDSRLLIIFQGNTARIANIIPINVDPFQLLALGEFLRDRGHRMIATQQAMVAQRLAQEAAGEDAKSKEQILVAGRIPDDPSAFPPDLRQKLGG